MNHSNNNFYDLSINGVKINITDISSNNFSQNRDFSRLHTSSENNNVFKNKLPPLYQYNKNKIDIKKDIDDFNMSINKLLNDIYKKNNKPNGYNNTINKLSTYEQNRILQYNKYKGFLDKSDDQIKKDEKNSQDAIVYYNPNKNTKTEFDKLLERLDNNFHKQHFSNPKFNGGLKDYNTLYTKDYTRVPPPSSYHRSQIPKPPEIKKTLVEINETIESLDDLLSLIEKNPVRPDLIYNINMQTLHNIKEPLVELNNMIGMKQLKTNVVDQILFFIQDLHNISAKNNQDFMHTVIYGPPGTGKTEIAKIMGSIFSKMGILNKNIFKKATRSDLIAGYLGQTAIKTRDLVTSCLGGVLFIDEAYALGNEEKRDSFAKECIDTLCEALSDHKHELMVIIAGYEKELKQCFFNYNQGLESRFTWRFQTDDYDSSELKKIFQKKVVDCGWSFDDAEDLDSDWFKNKMNYFKYYGRDMETLFAKTKIAHSRRVFCRPKSEKTKITIEDLEKGYKLYLQNDEVKNRDDKKELEKSIRNSLYL